MLCAVFAVLPRLADAQAAPSLTVETEEISGPDGSVVLDITLDPGTEVLTALTYKVLFNTTEVQATGFENVAPAGGAFNASVAGEIRDGVFYTVDPFNPNDPGGFSTPTVISRISLTGLNLAADSPVTIEIIDAFNTAEAMVAITPVAGAVTVAGAASTPTPTATTAAPSTATPTPTATTVTPPTATPTATATTAAAPTATPTATTVVGVPTATPTATTAAAPTATPTATTVTPPTATPTATTVVAPTATPTATTVIVGPTATPTATTVVAPTATPTATTAVVDSTVTPTVVIDPAATPTATTVVVTTAAEQLAYPGPIKVVPQVQAGGAAGFGLNPQPAPGAVPASGGTTGSTGSTPITTGTGTGGGAPLANTGAQTNLFATLSIGLFSIGGVLMVMSRRQKGVLK